MAVYIDPNFLSQGTDLFSLHGFMDETQATVEDMLAVAHAKSDSAVATANEAIADLRVAVFPDDLPEPPAAPAIQANITGRIGAVGYEALPSFGAITQGTGIPPTLDEIEIPDVIGTLPTYTRLVDAINLTPVPPMALPARIARPAISYDFDTPEAPVAAYGDLPDLHGVTIPSFTPPVLSLFDEPAPTFTGAVPDPFVGWAEPVYTSVFGTRVSDTLTTMMDGGTGLTADVEAAIWARARGREDTIARKAIMEAANEWGSRGYTMPPGELRLAAIAVVNGNNEKVSSLGRDVAIAQADLEQKNRQFAVEKGISYEGLMVSIFLAVTDRSFQLAKFAVESQILIYNAQIAGFNVEQQIYAQKIERSKMALQYAMAQIEAFKAQLDAQKLIGEIDNTLIQGYIAKVNAFNAQVAAYGELVKAAVARASIEKGKIDLYRGEIDGYVAQVGAKKTEFDAHIALNAAEASKVGLEKANAEVYTAQVEAVIKTNEVYFRRAEAMIENNKAKTQYTLADLDRLRTSTQQQLAAIQAGAAMYEASTRRAAAESTFQTEVERLKQSSLADANRNVLARYSASVALYATRVTQIIEMAKINASSLQAVGQIASNLAAGAMAGTSVGAQISSQGSATESKSATASKSAAVQDSNSVSTNYSTNHNYSHEE